MISIKSIDVHTGHDSTVGGCFAKRSRIYRIGKTPWLASCFSFHARWRVGPSRRNQYGKQNVEIIDLYVETEKTKNELFQISYILIDLATF